MKKNALPMPLIVGIFMVAGVFAMIALTLLIDDEGSFSSHGTAYKARFDSVEGLSPGSYVYLAGKKVGNVRAVDIDDVQGQAIVEFTLDQPYKYHLHDKLVIVQRSPITDSKRMDIVRTPGDTALFEGTEITGEKVQSIDFAKLTDSMTQAFQTVQAKVDKLDVDSINGSFRGVQKLTDEVESGEGNVGAIVKNVRTFTNSLIDKEGPVQNVLTNKEWTARVDRSLANVDKFTADLNNPDGFLHKAMTDKKFGDEVTSAMADIKKFTGESLNNENGTMHMLFHDPKFKEDLQASVGDIRQASTDLKNFTSGLNNQESLVYRLINDKAWSTRMDSVLADAHDLLSDLKYLSGKMVRGEGTIGKLLVDESLYKSVEGLVGEIRRAVDDAREFTPVSSALSAIIGVAR
ncbi:MAG TPA: MlaD family protein [Planctomycetota bacterium]|nr:MlaD family protein [Planctomycetota bacterium]